MHIHTTIPLALGALLAACSGSTTNDLGSGTDAGIEDAAGSLDGGGAADAPSTVTPQQASQDLATALCNKIDACSHALIQLEYGSASGCAMRLQPYLLSGFTATGSTLTPAQGEQCIQDLGGIACGSVFGRALPASCHAPPGTLADAVPCGSDNQCQNQRCKIPANAVCGTCGARAVAGGACGVDDDCQDALQCAPNALCVKYGMGGDTCDGNHPCRADFRCESGTCAVPIAAGMTCKDPTGNDCDASQGYYCNGAASPATCQAVGLATPGNTCGIVNSAFVACQGPGAYCKGFNPKTSLTGTCLAPAADGMACDNTNGPLCSLPAVCMNGTCAFPDATMCK